MKKYKIASITDLNGNAKFEFRKGMTGVILRYRLNESLIFKYVTDENGNRIDKITNKVLMTSPVESVTFEGDTMIVTTENSVYTLVHEKGE